MLSRTAVMRGSLRYRRPYWMMFLTNQEIDNWRIYTVIHRPDHQAVEMAYQSWLGGLDRPYSRPKCMAKQPLWLEKKRFMLKKSRLGAPETALERYVLDWHAKYHSFRGTVRPTAAELVTAFDLVERPLDLSYACQLLSQCRNTYNIRLGDDTFEALLEACLRVQRRDVAEYALSESEALGFKNIDENIKKYLRREQSWYKQSAVDGLYYPLKENTELNATARPAAPQSEGDLEEELAALDAELAMLQAEEEAEKERKP